MSTTEVALTGQQVWEYFPAIREWQEGQRGFKTRKANIALGRSAMVIREQVNALDRTRLELRREALANGNLETEADVLRRRVTLDSEWIEALHKPLPPLTIHRIDWGAIPDDAPSGLFEALLALGMLDDT